MLKSITMDEHLIKRGMKKIITQVSTMMIHLMKRMESTYRRRNLGSELETEEGKGGTNIGLQTGLVMVLHHAPITLSPQSRLLALKCLMELEDLQWEEAGVLYPIKINKQYNSLHM